MLAAPTAYVPGPGPRWEGMVVFGTACGRSQRRERHLLAHGLDLAGSDGDFRRGGREISWPMAWKVERRF